MNSSTDKASRLKTILNFAFIGLAIVFLVLLFVFKGNMNTFMSKKMKEQSDNKTAKSMALLVDSSFNYQKNGEGFDITFLEFGATGCISCRKMEIVMKEIKQKYPREVKVKFINILLPENQDMMKYFGIAVIPTQVLLDASSKEVFRHTGIYSTDELEREF
jgi:thioredoxin 1